MNNFQKHYLNNIFKGCNSLLIIPDFSKWNINIPNECINIPTFNSNSISIKQVKSNSLLSEEDIIKLSNLHEDLSCLKDNNNIKSSENINSIDFSNNNEELNDYYDNFYN